MGDVKRAHSAFGRDASPKVGEVLMRSETAAEALARAGFARGREVFGFNQGTFSLIDLIDAVVEITGPADCTIATWTAAKSDMGHVLDWLERGRLRQMTWLVDRSFISRQPPLCAMLRSMFGDKSIRVTRCHAKFVLLGNEAWSCTLLTSMNLNRNPRIENYFVSDDRTLYREYLSLVARVFDGQDEGAGFEDHAAVTAAMDAVSDGGRRKQKKKAIVSRPW